MTDKFVINLSIDASLVKYFIEAGHETEAFATDDIVAFLAAFLNDTRYPLAAKRTGEHDIELSYRLRAYADPIF